MENVFGQIWLVEEAFGVRMMEAFVARSMSGKEGFPIRKLNEVVRMMTAREDTYGAADLRSLGGPLSPSRGTAGLVAVIPVRGVMTRYGEACSAGDEWIAQQIEIANGNENVVGMVLKIDSPGGQVSGTKMLASAVKNSPKPIVSNVTEKCASKALWVASAGREIHLEDSTGMMVGCVGAMTVLVDERAKIEKEGAKPIFIRSENTPDKNAGNSVEGWSEADIAQIQAEITAMGREFEAVLVQNRPAIKAAALTGKVFDAKAALKLGLADRVCGLQDSVDRVAFLARKQF